MQSRELIDLTCATAYGANVCMKQEIIILPEVGYKTSSVPFTLYADVSPASSSSLFTVACPHIIVLKKAPVLPSLNRGRSLSGTERCNQLDL
jgi:hypothetical protein